MTDVIKLSNEVVKKVDKNFEYKISELFVSGREILNDEIPELQELININYCKNLWSRLKIWLLIKELNKDKRFHFEKLSNHSLGVQYYNRTILRICPLRKSWSVSVNRGKMKQDPSIADLFKEINRAIC